MKTIIRNIKQKYKQFVENRNIEKQKKLKERKFIRSIVRMSVSDFNDTRINSGFQLNNDNLRIRENHRFSFLMKIEPKCP